jgi:hypothetical protein
MSNLFVPFVYFVPFVSKYVEEQMNDAKDPC